MADTRRLEGKVAIVTGAGSSGPGIGNGKATAITFARHGAHVLLVDLRAEAAEETRRMIDEEGGSAVAMAADVTDARQCAAVVDRACAEFGGLDILHNNVGITKAGGVVEMEESDWNRIMSVNVSSVFLMSKHAIPIMVERGTGSIINVASVNGIRVMPAITTAYSASKAAVLAITREVAIQYAPMGVRCNAILPGYMRTPMVEAQLVGGAYGADADAMDRARARYVPMGRQGEGWDTAHAALFLASAESRYVTGAELVVDGGVSIYLPKFPA